MTARMRQMPMYFYPRSPCGERRQRWNNSPRSPLFLSTLSLRRATLSCDMAQGRLQISIHALLAESDSWAESIAAKVGNFYPRSPCGERPWLGSQQPQGTTNFYPRSPCGERPPNIFRHCTTYLFLSTLSLRRATAGLKLVETHTSISIHALLAESDSCTSIGRP